MSAELVAVVEDPEFFVEPPDGWERVVTDEPPHDWPGATLRRRVPAPPATLS